MSQSEILIAVDTVDQSEKEVFDFSSPEDVLIEVVVDQNSPGALSWEDHSIECSTILKGTDGVTGAASYEHSYGGGLDYVLEQMIDCPGAGIFVVEGITGVYHRGDGWSTDDDMDFDCTGVRPATPEEAAQL